MEHSGTSNEDTALLADLAELFAEADSIWDRSQNDPGFGGYVSADFEAVYDYLKRLQGQAVTFLEFGSGLGVVTMMASRLGFEAYGIEAEGVLVDFSRELAKRFAPAAQFALGSFIPDEFVWEPDMGEEVHITQIDVPSGYDDLEMELRDFDIVYAYPWPTEHELYHSIMRRCGSEHSLLLMYDAREGMGQTRGGEN